MIEASRYHKFLRVSAVLMATVLVFDGGFFSPVTKDLSDGTINYVASVSGGSGLHVSVPPNEVNSLTAQIADQQRELDAREAALSEREISSRNFGVEEDKDYSTYVLSLILFILTTLIVFNYILDWNRVRRTRYGEATA